MKLIEIIKKNGMLLVAGLAVIGFSAFKVGSKTTTSKLWYTVSLADPNLPNTPSNQIINPSSGTSSEPTFPCNQEEGIICSVELTLGTSSTVPANMEEAQDRQSTNPTDVKIENRSHYDE